VAVLFHNQKKSQGYNYGEDEGSNHFFLTLFPESDLDTRESTRKPVEVEHLKGTFLFLCLCVKELNESDDDENSVQTPSSFKSIFACNGESAITLDTFWHTARTNPNEFKNGKVLVKMPFLSPNDIAMSCIITIDLICVISSALHVFRTTGLKLQFTWSGDNFGDGLGLKRCKIMFYDKKICNYASRMFLYDVIHNLPIYVLFKNQLNSDPSLNFPAFFRGFLLEVFTSMKSDSSLPTDVKSQLPTESALGDLSKIQQSLSPDFLAAFAHQLEQFPEDHPYHCTFIGFRPGDKAVINNPDQKDYFFDNSIARFKDYFDSIDIFLDLRVEFTAVSKTSEQLPISPFFNAAEMLPLVRSAEFEKDFEISKKTAAAFYWLGDTNIISNVQYQHRYGQFKLYDARLAQIKKLIPFQKGQKNPLTVMTNVTTFLELGKKAKHIETVCQEINTKKLVPQIVEALENIANVAGGAVAEWTVPIRDKDGFDLMVMKATSFASKCIGSKGKYFGFMESYDWSNTLLTQFRLRANPLYAMLEKENKWLKQSPNDPRSTPFQHVVAAGLMASLTRMFKGSPNFLFKCAEAVVPVEKNIPENIFVPNYDQFLNRDPLEGIDPQKIQNTDVLYLPIQFAVGNLGLSREEEQKQLWDLANRYVRDFIERPQRGLSPTTEPQEPQEPHSSGQAWLGNYIKFLGSSYSALDDVSDLKRLQLDSESEKKEIQTCMEKKQRKKVIENRILEWNRVLKPSKDANRAQVTVGDVCLVHLLRYHDAQTKKATETGQAETDKLPSHAENFVRLAFSLMHRDQYKAIFSKEVKRLSHNTTHKSLEHSKLYLPKRPGAVLKCVDDDALMTFWRDRIEVNQLPSNWTFDYSTPSLQNRKLYDPKPLERLQLLLEIHDNDHVLCACVQALFSIVELRIRTKAQGKISHFLFIQTSLYRRFPQ
jgi:hypothetical protein